MAKPGPTPQSDDAENTARRVPTPALLPEPIDMPEPPADWQENTRHAYVAFVRSDAARILREEDRQEVVLLFGLIDQRLGYLSKLSGLPSDDLKALQAVKIVDGMIDRKQASLGLGPLARTRLGVATLEAMRQAQQITQNNRQKTGTEEF